MSIFTGYDPVTGCQIAAIELSGVDVDKAAADSAVRSLRLVARGGAIFVVIARCFDFGVSSHIERTHPDVQLWIRDVAAAGYHHLPANKAASEFLIKQCAARRR